MKRVVSILLFVLFLQVVANAQAGVGINTDGSQPDGSAILDLKSIYKGMLIPRMTSAQRVAIGSPATGLQVYDTNTNTFWFFNSFGWTEMTVGGGGPSYWTQDGSGNIYNNNTGRILLGSNVVGPAYLNIKSQVSTQMGFFMSETGTTTADYMFAGIYTGGGTTSTRYGAFLGNFGNGFGLGNQANGPLTFQTSTSEKMRITAAGNVGINTLTPTSLLEVRTPAINGTPGITHTDGTIRLTTMINTTNAAIGTTTNHHLFFFTNNNINIAPPAMTISTAGNVGIGGIVATEKVEAYTPDANYGFMHTSAGGIQVGSYVGSGGGWYGTKSNHPLYLFSQTGNAYIALLQSGNVGIGTYNPAAKLDLVLNSATGFPQLLLEENDNDYARLNFKTVNAANSGGNFWSIAAYNNNTRANEKLNFWNNAVGDVMTIVGNGNVGIGTNNPTYKLSVNGTIQTKEIRVQTGWADFVFESDYVLQPLPEVEKFIQANKHLPGIPSAKEIQTNGLAVGDVQTKMMQKIEELTLYLIEANKTIEELKKRIDLVEKANK